MQSSVENSIPQGEEQHLFEKSICDVLGTAVALEEGYPYPHKSCPPRSQRKGLANSPPIKPEGQRRRRTEHQNASGTRAKNPEDVVASRELLQHGFPRAAQDASSELRLQQKYLRHSW
ncbi:uncharacterized protein FYW23_005748 [Sylvia borin]